jgi:hypothetical protein
MFLGDGRMSGEDNIFFLVHELFTGGSCIKNPAIFSANPNKKGRFANEAPTRSPRGR